MLATSNRIALGVRILFIGTCIAASISLIILTFWAFHPQTILNIMNWDTGKEGYRPEKILNAHIILMLFFHLHILIANYLFFAKKMLLRYYSALVFLLVAAYFYAGFFPYYTCWFSIFTGDLYWK